MAVFKCKMCGASLEVSGVSTIRCDYCDSVQTLPKLSDDRISNLYDRANHFRRNNEFDKAANAYEKILNEDKTDSEAYWSLVLCRYGIEYVEDPSTHKRVPTVNRAQFTSVYDDDNYKMAVKYADASQKAIYEAEANAINEIQKGILAISQKEEPFDVFICYKETDNNGRRTPDSVLANDLYHQLKNEGYKVFFARITLEDKLGTAYEPYIFAALQSSKVMVVLGTKPEYFNAVWVKNEWSRYLSLIKSGAQKILIPAYKDMDPYDLPEEFSHLQAQDMSKLGFMQDLIRGIKKLCVKEEPKETVIRQTTVVSSGGGNIDTLLKRVSIFLRDGDFKSADEYCEKVLDIDPENAMAYLGKLLAERNCRRKEDLAACTSSFEASVNFRNVERYADKALKDEVRTYLKAVTDRIEYNTNKKLYDNAKMKMASNNLSDVETALALFKDVKDFEDAKLCIENCKIKIADIKKDIEKKKYESDLEAYNSAKALMEKNTVSDLNEAKDRFEEISGFKDSAELIKKCDELLNALNNDILYAQALELMKVDTTEKLQTAIGKLKTLNGWKDSDQKIKECEDRIKALTEKAEADRIAKVKKRKLGCITAVIIMILIIAALGIFSFNYKKIIFKYGSSTEVEIDGIVYSKYENTTELLEDKVYVKDCYSWKLDSDIVIKGEVLGFKVIEIGNDAFNYASDIKSVTIPDGVTSIGYDAFYGCNSLTSVDLPESVEYIRTSAFSGCTSLTSINLPDGLEDIGGYTFNNCSSLTEITIPDSVTSIGIYAFANCYALTEITIPDSVTSIGKYAFENCDALTDITFSDTAIQIDDNAFGYSNDLSNITFHCNPNTNAYRFAEDKGAKIDLIK